MREAIWNLTRAKAPGSAARLNYRREPMITGGFGMTMDLERGTMRQWVMSGDGVKRWADTNEPVENLPEMPTCTKSKTADFVSVPTISMRQLHLDDGSYGVALTVTGLASEQQAEAAMDHMQRLFCGAEISEQ